MDSTATRTATRTLTATVYDADTGDALDGAPTAELVRESLAAGDTGAVAAYRDGDGVWHYVPDCRESHYRDVLGEDVRIVYVDDYEPEVEVDLDSVEVYDGDAESDELSVEVYDGDAESDELSHYISVDVTVDGERATVGVVVGAPEADHGSVRASGAGVRPFCTAWWADASDWQDVAGAREAVIAALKDASWELFLRARARARR